MPPERSHLGTEGKLYDAVEASGIAVTSSTRNGILQVRASVPGNNVERTFEYTPQTPVIRIVVQTSETLTAALHRVLLAEGIRPQTKEMATTVGQVGSDVKSRLYVTSRILNTEPWHLASNESVRTDPAERAAQPPPSGSRSLVDRLGAWLKRKPAAPKAEDPEALKARLIKEHVTPMATEVIAQTSLDMLWHKNPLAGAILQYLVRREFLHDNLYADLVELHLSLHGPEKQELSERMRALHSAIHPGTGDVGGEEFLAARREVNQRIREIEAFLWRLA